MKTPISYYGGKQMMLRHILPLIPKHDLYTESFCGGAAVFWAKEASKTEVINDVNRAVTNFYTVLKSKFKQLKRLVEQTPNARSAHSDAYVIYTNPWMFDDVQRAWSFFVLSAMSYVSKLNGGFGYDKKAGAGMPKSWYNKKLRLTDEYAQRLELVSIECRSAIDVIKSRDTSVAFHYVDPPYFNSDMGHYRGYSENDFIDLLDVLSNIEGKFLLSCYPSTVIDEFIESNQWHRQDIKKNKPANKGVKVEVLVANYAI